jgi:hypothetical protein
MKKVYVLKVALERQEVASLKVDNRTYIEYDKS